MISTATQHPITVIGTQQDSEVFAQLNDSKNQNSLPLLFDWQMVEKVNHKTLLTTANQYPLYLAIIKSRPIVIYQNNNNELNKITPNWQALTTRIVGAGRKSELILQASKLNTGMSVIDATAGFGHDGLIMASTGANVTMLENNPIMALLLFYEYHLMNENKNWQKLLSRITISYINAVEYLTNCDTVDMVYLDPMFPDDSYGAKVGKNMQMLHNIAAPPTFAEEKSLLTLSLSSIQDDSKVIVKRPISAPNFAGQPCIQSVSNNAIRFDIYSNS
ncbi:MAG: class I SAM-dependent methyltransferase [Moraxella sp.]|nr:class I SAM-dependent methyltransferase [Moraxella sp.]